MSGRLVDLSQPNASIPNPVVVDTNVVIAFFQRFFPGSRPQQASQASAFFRHLRTAKQQAILPPTAYSELLHIAVRDRYRHLVHGQQRALSARLGARISDWKSLYKHDPSILRQYRRNLSLIRQGLILNNVVISGPEDFDFRQFGSASPYQEELIDRMVRYGLDTSDTLIVMEASRLGVASIVTMDGDLQRALVDVDIYTWL